MFGIVAYNRFEVTEAELLTPRPKNNYSMGAVQISVNEMKTGATFVWFWVDMYRSVLFWRKDVSFRCLNIQRMDPYVFGVASRSDNVIMTPYCSTLPVLTPLWEIQANYADTGGAVGAALRRKTSVIPEFP